MLNIPFNNYGKRIGIFVIAYTYNAESHITETLNRIDSNVWDAVSDLYIVDDCSIDDTVKKALCFDKKKEKMIVLRNRVNKRYGGNQKIGYQYAIDNDLDIVVMLHADGQYASECIQDIVNPILTGKANMVIGSRMVSRRSARW